MTATLGRPGLAATAAGYTPSLEAVERLLAGGGANCVPIYREVLADLETPVSAYLKVARGSRYAFLLESVEGGERLARYSFIGADPALTLRLHDGRLRTVAAAGATEERPFADPLVALQEELGRYRTVSLPDLPRFVGGAVGYLGYEAVRYFEELPVPANDALGLPDGLFLLADTLLVFDHVRRRVKIVSHVLPDRTAGDVPAAYTAARAWIDELLARLCASIGSTPVAWSNHDYFESALWQNIICDKY